MFINLFAFLNIKKALNLDNTNDARWLLEHILKCSSTYIINNPNKKLSFFQKLRFLWGLSLLKKGYPLAYITKSQPFYKYDFYVKHGVLIPRADSESLIQATLKVWGNKKESLNILEIGVGSGAIITSLLKEYENARGLGVDISSNALKVAGKNAKTLGVASRLMLLKSNIFNSVPNNQKFELIISNPPYIDFKDKDISESVKKFEPKKALFAKNQGLYFYQEIFKNAKKYLKNNGRVVVEFGHLQSEDVRKIATTHGFSLEFFEKDSGNIIRCGVFYL
jgi:release factor glutamine methyltransferase